MNRFIIAFLTAALAIGVAQAEQRPLEIGNIVSQQQQLRTELMARSGRYKNMPEAKRNELLSRQQRLLVLLDGKQTSAELSDDERKDAVDTLDWIAAAIKNTDDDRMVCKRERTIGSQRVTQKCRSQAQMRADNERAREEIDKRSIDARR